MPFLDQYDALPAGDAPARIGLFLQWLRSDWRELFAELREHRPVLDVPLFLLVTRWSDVVGVLSRPGTFNVAYRAHMDPSVGPFMLARDNSELNWHEKSVMRSLLRYNDLPVIRAVAGETAATALADATRSSTTVDIVAALSRLVPLRVVQRCFGFAGPDDATMLRWSKATQLDMFYNLSDDPHIHAANVQAGTEMQKWLWDFLEQRKPWSEAQGDDTVSRLLRMTDAGFSDLDPARIVSNLCGLLVGAIETMSQAINAATEQILLRPEIASSAIAAAQANDTARLDSIVWEALRFNPITTFVVRVAAEDAVIAPDSDHATKALAGRMVAAAIGSAMFDADVFFEPDTFRDRPTHCYLHTGFGQHECLGQHIAFAVVPEAIRHILMLPGVHLLDGEAGKIDMGGGPFAERFALGLTAASTAG